MSRAHHPRLFVRSWLLLAAAALLVLIALLTGPGAIRAQSGEPTVTAVAVSSNAGGDDTYAKGDVIRITVTFSEAVDVTGKPALKIDMDPADWGEKQAAYDSGTGSTSLTFAHTVVEPNLSTQGIAVLANSLALNGGTIKSSSSQIPANLAHSGLAHDANHKVNWQQSAPTVTAVAVTSAAGDDHTYTKDDVIQVTLTFSEAVDVTGAPQLSIDMDPAEWGEKQAAYQGGTGSTALTFTHTVVEPNISTQGIAVLANSLALNGGAIKSSSSQIPANLAHSGLAHDANHKVNWQQSAPTVTGVAVTSGAGDDHTYTKDDVIQVTLTFSEAVDVTGAPQLSIDMDPAEWGEKQAAYQGGTGSTALTFTHTVVEPNISTQGIAVLANSLALNGGAIKSSSSQIPANLAHSGLAHDAAHKVDWRLLPPTCAQTAPSSVSALTIGQGAVVSWTLPDDLSDACQVSGFVVTAVNEAEGLSLEALVSDPAARTETIRGLPAGDYVFSVRVEYAEGNSEDLVTAEANAVPDACITLTVQPYARDAISGRIASVNGTGCQAREQFDFEYRRTGDDYWKSYGKMPWSMMQQSNPSLPHFIAYSLKPNVSYDFRIAAYDASDSKYVTTGVSATITAQDPSATADTGSPTGVRLRANNGGNIVLAWNAYGAPAGRTLTDLVVEWKACPSPGSPTGCTGTTTSETVDTSIQRLRITGLTDGMHYTARIAARTHATDDQTKTTSDAWSVWAPAVTTWSEPTQVFFHIGPQNIGSVLFISADTNKGFQRLGMRCVVASDSGSQTLNCPTRTLISPLVTGTISATINHVLDGVTTSTKSTGRAGGPAAPRVFASGGNGTMVVEWIEPPAGGRVGNIDRYIVRTRAGTSGAWSNTNKGVTDRSHTFTSLANGTWQVHVRARSDGDDGDPLTTDSVRLGFQSDILTVTLAAGNTATVKPPRVRVFPGDSRSLIAEWDLITSGSIPYAYQVRHRASGTDAWTESAVLFPRPYRAQCTYSGECTNPRRHEITGLTGGTKYEVAVRAKNANGWGAWVHKAGDHRPND